MNNDNNLESLTTILNALKGLDKEAQKRTLHTVITFLDIDLSPKDRFYASTANEAAPFYKPNTIKNEITFSEDRAISPKDFLRDKSPKTDIERIVCLAYYLTHYRETPHFKTFDLSSLNTEAAQPKLSNPAVAVDNASKAGLLVQAIKGSKQISAAGEVLVQALPDREAAKSAIANLRIKRRPKKSTKNAKPNLNNNS